MKAIKFFALSLLLLLAVAALASASEQMSVTVKETQLRASPGYLGKVLGSAKYGDRLDVLEKVNGWAKVSLPGGKSQGWVHLSALTVKKIVFKAGEVGGSSGASSKEVALAGKGFNQEVEASYREESQLDYAWVDRMETYRASPEQLLAFLRQGGLPETLGGAE